MGETTVLRPKHHQITGKTLFSAHENAGGGLIPVQIGSKGIICFPDFTTVLSRNSRDRTWNF